MTLSKTAKIYQAYKDGMAPPDAIPLDEWADKYRYISAKTMEKWHTSKVEVARGPLQAVTESGVKTITVMTCTQLLKTEVILNAIGYYMHIDPCPMLVVHPTDAAAKRFSGVRLEEMIDATPELNSRIVDTGGQRTGQNTTSHKEFPGGHVSIVSGRTPANLSMLPIRVVLLDEIDKYEDSAGTEGDPVDLAEERMSKYAANSLSIRACSPTIRHESRIESSYLSSDQRKPIVSCPHCGYKQILYWSNVQWNKADDGTAMTDSACIVCSHCGSALTELERQRMLKSVEWRQFADFTCSNGKHNQPSTWDMQESDKWDSEGRALCECCNERASNRHAGFWANKLYSPFTSVPDLARKWLDAQGNIESLKTFINTQLGESFEQAGDRIDRPDYLMARREPYDGELPNGVGIVTAGVDTQDNRLELEVVGWGVDEESWSLDYRVFPGDPSRPEVWQQLESYLNSPWHRKDGMITYVAAAAIDMQGSHTQAVAQFCSRNMNRKFWPIRGVGGDGRPHPVWPRNPGRTNKSNVPFYNVGVDTAKNTIFARLLIESEGPGYCHFPHGRDEDYFHQLTAEKRVRKRRGTQYFYAWENPGHRRNEGFDCRVYSYAALTGLQSMGWKVNMITENESLILPADHEQKKQEKAQGKKGGKVKSYRK